MIESTVIRESLRSVLAMLMAIALIQFSPSLIAQEGDTEENQRWVSDQFEITMRKGRDSTRAIVRMLPSGSRLELLREDSVTGYSLVATPGGTEGWVLSRYLDKTPPARIALPKLQARLQESEGQRRQLEQEVRRLNEERSSLQRETSQLENSGTSLQRELDEVRRLSSNAIEVNNQNKELRKRLAENERLLDELRSDNIRLGSRSNREWFIIGALVLLFGILIGLILPRIRWRKNSGWGEL